MIRALSKLAFHLIPRSRYLGIPGTFFALPVLSVVFGKTARYRYRAPVLFFKKKMGDSDHSEAESAMPPMRPDADLPESGDDQMMDLDADTEVQVVSPPAKRQAKVPAAQAARDNALKEARWATIISKSLLFCG